jgi:uncharacterized membrane protein YqhA
VNPIHRIIVNTRYMAVIAVICLSIGAAIEFLWGAVYTYHVAVTIWGGHEKYEAGVVGLLHLLDAFLVAISMLIIAMGTYELFITNADLPEVMLVRTLHGLKVKAISMMVLIMGVSFIEHVMAWEDAWGTLLFGSAITLVTLALVAFARFTEQSHEA